MFNRFKNQTGYVEVIGMLGAVVIVLAAVYGYVENLLKLFRIEHINGHIGEVTVRVVGVFTGLVGAVAGYF